MNDSLTIKALIPEDVMNETAESLLANIVFTSTMINERDERLLAIASNAYDSLELTALKNKGKTDHRSRQIFLAIEEGLESVSQHMAIERCAKELQRRLTNPAAARTLADMPIVDTQRSDAQPAPSKASPASPGICSRALLDESLKRVFRLQAACAMISPGADSSVSIDSAYLVIEPLVTELGELLDSLRRSASFAESVNLPKSASEPQPETVT